MNIPFFKYQGAGNDFILVDNRKLIFPENDVNFIKNLCDRRFGIGADGLMLLENHPDFDFEMKYFNADGKPGSMCGNGGRCIVAFAQKLGLLIDKTDFLAPDGGHYAEFFSDTQLIKLGMNSVDSIEKWGDEGYFLNTGSPHLVIQEDLLEDFDVYNNGKHLRHHPDFEQGGGTNVNFIKKTSESEDSYFLRTFERGVEDETYACGTGATASAMVMVYREGKTGEFQIPVRVLGGQLQIYFHFDGKQFSRVFLEGPAELVFEGEVNLR